MEETLQRTVTNHLDVDNLTVEDLQYLTPAQKGELKVKLQKMQGNNEGEQSWDRGKHWPLLDALQESTGGGYIPLKDRPRRG